MSAGPTGQPATLPPLDILLATPRGFCAGVDRAIRTVEIALEQHGPPVYVRHEIVHNQHVVDSLRRKGAIFVAELEDCPTDRPVVLSAHGVPKRVIDEARERNLFYIDATCPLVTKVHIEARKHHAAGRHIVLIGHADHQEIIGTMGQLPEGAATLVETLEDIENLAPEDPDQLAYATQTTLSVDDTARLIDRLRQRFPSVRGPHGADICYASTNRQASVKAIAPRVDSFLVLGADNSSNSKRLISVALDAGCPAAQLIRTAGDVDWEAIRDARAVGVTAGASAPEILVEELIGAFRTRFLVRVEEVQTAVEDISFRLPREVRQAAH